MPVLKIYKNGSWETINGGSGGSSSDADTLDGMHADEFAQASDLDQKVSYSDDPVYAYEDSEDIYADTINADTLQGHPASDFATPAFVTNKIAEAQLGGGSGGESIDLSGLATKDELNALDTEVKTKYVLSSKVNIQTFITMDQIGLSGAVTIDQVCEAMPEYSIFMYANSTTGLSNYVTDVPATYMNLEFYKAGNRCIVEASATGTLYPRSFEGTWHPSSRWSGWREKLTSVLHSTHYGTTLPDAGTPGRIFFKKVT